MLIAPLAVRELRKSSRPTRIAVLQSVLAGVIGGIAALCYLSAAGLGQLAIIAVLASMYPAVTVLLARILLGEKWTRLQALGLILSGLAVVLVVAA